MTGTCDVLIYVQHLLGIGHLKRAAAIARTAAEKGLETVVVSGGHDVPGIDFGKARVAQLPAVSVADVNFSRLLDEGGREVDEAWRTRRRDRLLAIFGEVRPDVLLTELFPFGRRQFRFELLPLLQAARASDPRPAIACSVRDILVEKPKPERNREVVETIRQYYDAVLVHGDPDLIELGRTFPMAPEIEDGIRYTGYVADRSGWLGGRGAGEVLVSAGGGSVGEPLLRAALAAMPLSKAAEATWRLLTGPNLSDAVFNELRDKARAGVVVERHRTDFAERLSNCALSVSQGGYNTVMDILATGARSVIVPFAAGGESEQTLRARLLAERGRVVTVEETDLSPERLARAIDAALSANKPETVDIKLDGAAETARHLKSLALKIG
ncbi:MAG: glycosyl transferase [Rhodospirillales bacterium]|nr:glycosyl transferase [Rhodospirillales bacterium]